MRKRHTIRIHTAKLLIVLFIVFIGSAAFIQWRAAPVIDSVAAVQAKGFAVTAINQAASDVLESAGKDSSETITASEDGILRSIETNTVQANKLKHLITLKAQEKLSDINHQKINIPLGMLLGGELFGTSGPEIPMYISLSGNTSSDFEEVFESAGINQTAHKLSLKISADITVLTPSGTLNETVETSVLIGETVIVGSAPNGILYRQQTDNS